MNSKLSYIFCLMCIFILSPVTNANKYWKKPKIIGGELIERDEIKYAVSIHRDGNATCTGGIIGDKYVLSAAHCFINGQTKEFISGKLTVVAGTNNFNNLAGAVELNVVKIYVPIVFDGTYWNDQHQLGDIAVLELEKPLNVTLNEVREALNLPEAEEQTNTKLYEDTVAKVAGFGWNNITTWIENGFGYAKGSTDGGLRKADVVVVPYYRCLHPSQRRRTDILCARVINYSDGTHQGTCTGDSGAPLVIKYNIVIGLQSSSVYDCNENNKPGTYTKIPTYVKFIKNVLDGQTQNMHVEQLKQDEILD